MATALTDYTWDEHDDWAHSIRLHSDEIPGRAALTAPLLVTHPDDSARILLVDPHPPGTWETWMFPYASMVLSAADIRRRRGDEVEFLRLAAGDTLATVADSVVRLRERLWSEYQDALATGYNNVLPHLRDSWGGEPVYRNFSLMCFPVHRFVSYPPPRCQNRKLTLPFGCASRMKSRNPGASACTSGLVASATNS